jgi:hypothetical protein
VQRLQPFSVSRAQTPGSDAIVCFQWIGHPHHQVTKWNSLYLHEFVSYRAADLCSRQLAGWTFDSNSLAPSTSGDSILARPDVYAFNLDSNGNLAQRLDVLNNDAGSGVTIHSWQGHTGFLGILGVSGFGTEKYFTYTVAQYR